jgi:urease accessory protein
VLRLLSTAIVVFAPTLAFAHPGHGAAGIAAGFAHPMGGIDHVLAMVAVGCLAAQMGGRALWALPAAFIGMMVAGGALGMAGIALPFVETGIALSLVCFGVAIAAGLRLPVAAGAAFVGLFALFHGHAHGAEMPETATGLEYGLGFVAATALLHLAGVGIGHALAWSGHSNRPARIAGAATALVGIGLLAGAV